MSIKILFGIIAVLSGLIVLYSFKDSIVESTELMLAGFTAFAVSSVVSLIFVAPISSFLDISEDGKNKIEYYLSVTDDIKAEEIEDIASKHSNININILGVDKASELEDIQDAVSIKVKAEKMIHREYELNYIVRAIDGKQAKYVKLLK